MLRQEDFELGANLGYIVGPPRQTKLKQTEEKEVEEEEKKEEEEEKQEEGGVINRLYMSHL